MKKKLFLLIVVLLLVCGCKKETTDSDKIPKGEYGIYQLLDKDGEVLADRDGIEESGQEVDYMYIDYLGNGDAIVSWADDPDRQYETEFKDDGTLIMHGNDEELTFVYSYKKITIKSEKYQHVYMLDYGRDLSEFEKMEGKYTIREFIDKNGKGSTSFIDGFTENSYMEIFDDRDVILYNDGQKYYFRINNTHIYNIDDPSDRFDYSYASGILTTKTDIIWSQD